jgi:hypothetical protein
LFSPEPVWRKPKPINSTRCKVLDEYIGGAERFAENSLVSPGLEVKADTFLATI